MRHWKWKHHCISQSVVIIILQAQASLVSAINKTFEKYIVARSSTINFCLWTQTNWLLTTLFVFTSTMFRWFTVRAWAGCQVNYCYLCKYNCEKIIGFFFTVFSRGKNTMGSDLEIQVLWFALHFLLMSRVWSPISLMKL